MRDPNSRNCPRVAHPKRIFKPESCLNGISIKLWVFEIVFIFFHPIFHTTCIFQRPSYFEIFILDTFKRPKKKLGIM